MRRGSLRAIVTGMNRWGVAACAYLLLSAMASGAATFWRGHSVFTLEDPWLNLGGGFAPHAFSGALGTCVGLIVVLSTKPLVMRFAFGARLHAELRPLALTLSTQMVVVLAT